ncbi:hypothetical protein LOTGIDRAFT_160101 [Lottia gigantea]|uniref:Uncharacterized protein n=1 Tax=Lottia gigantea TaxID=225164 RepID=V4AMW4_LOTGI|nr:hypothetical protein LOTGIDRAFT_160101 [Lottia gigantea]ESO96115.1 hypothetical protein LOTGIDRAFT_160101 [Lottia gigantea]
MEDTISRESVDSSSTSDEFVVVNADPKFKLTGDMNDIDKEICAEPVSTPDIKMDTSITDSNVGHAMPSSQSVDVLLPEGTVENKSYQDNNTPLEYGSPDSFPRISLVDVIS